MLFNIPHEQHKRVLVLLLLLDQLKNVPDVVPQLLTAAELALRFDERLDFRLLGEQHYGHQEGQSD